MREVFRIVAQMRAEGISVLLVEQNVRMSLDIADHAYVLDDGPVVYSGPARELAADEARVERWPAPPPRNGRRTSVGLRRPLHVLVRRRIEDRGCPRQARQGGHDGFNQTLWAFAGDWAAALPRPLDAA